MLSRFRYVFLSLACSSVALAQGGAPAPRTAPATPTVTPQQGEAIVAAVWTRERRGGPSPDCSHLVHEVYAIAGLSYPYTDSFDLYTGTGNFVRVTSPQAGDLIVWRGHVGIVVDPAEHSFYSSLRSGLGTDFYDAPYWKARGPARFYRFIRQDRTRVILAEERAEAAADPVKAISSRREDVFESSPTFAEASEPRPNATAVAAGVPDSSSVGDSDETPSSILVAARHRVPTNEEVAEAVSELNNAAAIIVRKHSFAQITRKVVIYDKLAVQHVDAKGPRGSATIRIDSQVALTDRHISRSLRHEDIRWKLIRTAQGWEISARPDCVYVPRDVAVHELAARLALLTQDANGAGTNSSRPEQAEIIRVLSSLAEGM